MTQLTIAKIALAAAGVIVWWYGNQSGQRTLAWIGIALLAVAVILRFVGKPAK